jgi:L-lactate utilization protein LutC
MKKPDKFESKAYEELRDEKRMTKDPVEKDKIQKKMDALMGIPVARAGGASQGSAVDFSKLPK